MGERQKKPNLQLRLERKNRGWSQARLAELIGADNSMVSRWETGERQPEPFYQEKLCTLFNKSAAELGFVEETFLLQSSILSITSANKIASLNNRQDSLSTNSIQREHIERLKKVLKLPSIDDRTIKHLEIVIENCWDMLPVVAGHVSYGSRNYVAEQLAIVIDLLERPQLTEVRERLCSFAGELSLIIANISSNVREYSTAKVYYELAIEAAQEANNSSLQAVSLVRLSFNFTRDNRANKALPLVEYATSLIEGKKDRYRTDITRAWIAAAMAEIYANLGKAYECSKALEHAEIYSYSMLSDDPYRTTFTPSLLNGYKGTSLVLLSRPKEAESVLQEALKNIHSNSDYQKGYILSDLANASIQQENIDGMYQYASEALLIAARTNSSEIFHRIYSLRTHIAASWKSLATIKALDNQIQISALQFKKNQDCLI